MSDHTRRRVLKTGAIVGSVPIVAGCLGDGDENGGGNGNPNNNTSNGNETNGPDPRPGPFQLSTIQPQETTVLVGTTQTVSAVVTNAGDAQGTQTVQLTIGSLTREQEVTLGGGAEQTVEFSIDTSELGSGEYDQRVSTEDDELSGRLTVDDQLTVGVIASQPESDPITDAIVGGAEIAAQELSGSDAVNGVEVEIMVGNAGLAGSEAADAYDELVREEEVDVTVGNFFSDGLRNLMGPVADAQQLHLVTGANTVELSENLREDYERYKYLFRVGPYNDAYLGQALVDFAAEHYVDTLGWDRTALLYEEAAWTQPVVEVLDDQFGDHGFEVVDTVSYSPAIENFTPIFQDLQSQNIDGVTTVMAATGAAAAGQWAAGAYDFGMGGIHVPAQLPGIADEFGSFINNVWTLNTASPGATITDQTDPFTQSYMDREGEEPFYTGYLAYDAVRMYAQYAAHVGSLEDEEIVAAMAGNELDLTTTTDQSFRFWERGEETPNGKTYPHDVAYDREAWLSGEAAPIVNQWQNGEMEIVAPESQATAAYQQVDR